MQVDFIRFAEREDRTLYLVKTFSRYLQGRILDVGCDQAPLKKLLPGCDHVGIDIGGRPDIRINLEKVDRLPFEDASFDCVICIDVLEHLDNLHQMFQELLRLSRSYLILSLPNNWVAARVPIERGRGTFAHYGLPAERPLDRHKWFFSLSDARAFIRAQLERQPRWKLLEERVCEKGKNPVLRGLRRLRYPVQEHYLNRYAHTIWFALQTNLTGGE